MDINKVSPIPAIQRTQFINKDTSKENKIEIPIQNQGTKKEKIKEEELIHAIESANKKVEIYDRRFEFSIHEKTKEIIVKVIDKNTDEVIREIPNEKILDMVANMMELAGILVDERA